MRNNSRSVFVGLLLLLWSIIPFYRIFFVRFVDGHDFLLHLERIFILVESIKHGVILPRWLPNVLYGYGSPLFSVYWGVPYYFGAILKILGASYEVVFKILLILPNIVSFFGMYLWVKKGWHDKFIAFISATIYLWTPYRFLDTFIRGALGEIFAFAFIPFVFYSFESPLDPWKFIMGSVSLSLLIYSHQGLAFFTFIIICFFIGLKFIKDKKLRIFQARCKIIITGLLLAAFFWLPALNSEHLLANYQKSISTLFFPPAIALIRSAWEGGYINGIKLIMSYEIGLMNIFLFILGNLLLIYYLRKKRIFYQLLFWLSVFWISVFLMLPVSKWFWLNIPFIANLQFPFRLLYIPMLVCPIIAAIILSNFKHSSRRIILGIFMVIGVIVVNRNHLGVLNKDINLAFLPNYQGSLDVDGERTPYYMNINLLEAENRKGDQNEFALMKGNGNILKQERQDLVSYALIMVNTASIVKIHRAYFPGWNITVDDRRIQPVDIINGTYITLEQGRHEIIMFYKDPLIVTISNLISIFTVIFIFIKIMTIKKLKNNFDVI